MTRVLGSLSLVSGGLAWVAFALVCAGMSYGASATFRLLTPAEPLSSTHRDLANVAPYLAVAVVLTLVGLALLYGQAAWAAGPGGKASVILLALSPLLFAPWPLLFFGFLCFVVGMLVLGIASLRTGSLLPRSAAAMLIAAAILLFFFNFEDDRVLMAIAPGIAFFALGARSLTSVGR